MTLRTRRRPGFRFETQPPPARDVLPRMDIAVFVGFAASGPLHVPVAIEDPTRFQAIFGPDLPLAWNPMRGEQVYAYLGPAVRAFFRCGGQRCHVIRVANIEQARVNRFQLPGMAQVQVNAAGVVTGVRPVDAQARSEGSWSDGLRVSTALLSRSIQIVDTAANGTSLVLLNSPVQAGDVLRLTYREAGLMRLVLVGSVEPVAGGWQETPTAPRRAALRANILYSLWLSELLPVTGPLTITSPKMYARLETGESLDLILNAEDTRFDTRGGTVVLILRERRKLVDAPPVGSMITLDHQTQHLVLAVQDVSGGPKDAGQETIFITCTGVRWMATSPTPPEAPIGERLSFELRTRTGTGDPVVMDDLAFARAHPRSWSGAPETDENFRASDRRGLPSDTQWFTALNEEEAIPSLWRQAAEPRFPLAGAPIAGAFTFPYSMSVLPDFELPPMPNAQDALTRDGLANFETGLFLDPDLVGATTLDLAGRADTIRYLSDAASRPLRGIHAALAIEEATLIAVPDAVHPGWANIPAPDALNPKSSTPLPPLDWAKFLNCGTRILNAPVLSVTQQDAAGSFILSWIWTSDEPTDEPVFTLEEATQNDFSDAVMIYTGKASIYPIYGRARGDYYYRVRAAVDPNMGNWSNGIVVRIAPGSQWTLDRITPLTGRITLSIHRALLRLCASRADMVAMLSLPEHLREDTAMVYARNLTPFSTEYNPQDEFDFPLSFAEERALTYGTLYHPWIYTRDGDAVRSAPPDGAMCGMIARRSIARGAWIAPANEPIEGVIALTPPLAEERLLDLLNAQINIVIPSPYGYVAQTADTLSLDEDFRPLNVRRLMILLRRLVQRKGTQYVFEPFDDVFRRMVQRSLEAVLEDLFVRGAFAGRTTASAFQVVPRSTPFDADQGRFIVDLKVAPSLPMSFLTVRLVQSGDRSLVSEER